MNRDPFIAWELDIGSGYNHLRQCHDVKLAKQHTTILPLTRHLKSYVSSIISHRELPCFFIPHSLVGGLAYGSPEGNPPLDSIEFALSLLTGT